MGGCYFVLEHFLLLDFFMVGGRERLRFCGSCFLAAGSICICSPTPTSGVTGLCLSQWHLAVSVKREFFLQNQEQHGVLVPPSFPSSHCFSVSVLPMF